ncbi:MAG: site-specific DNA-methyltransferase [Candidatus Competibacteraceae bacterium]|nr:site-specific DNA-methyltransferase [Candidatus Competibacteraceae bacterium]MCB1820583.1 site-specific DNA-methyltransferase [Candidatus Competibacteraceae bacterium]HRY14539.1 site-specific DNA-methyltransferase [Candidatus Competibacteraceae bacterium]
MPTLNWIGKEAVVKHHKEAPFRLLEPVLEFSCGPANSGNLIVQGDNLHALKALLPRYAGQVKCIYIDPPYNTGNEGWVYNDNVNSPEIRKWLGEVVGKEGEMLDRHDRWLCMMYPRLVLLRQFLREDGAIFVSIDDNEVATLRLLMDEIFGVYNFIGSIAWKNATDNNPTRIVPEHEYILCFARDKQRLEKVWKSSTIASKEKLLGIEASILKKHKKQVERETAFRAWLKDNKPYVWPFQDYKFIDEHGIYTGIRGVHNPGKDGYRYDVIHPETKKPCKEPLMGYRFPEETMRQLVAEGRIIFGIDETKIIELKVYLRDYQAKLSSVYELDGRAGTNEIKDIFPESKRHFNFPKISQLIQDLISFATDKDSLILDSFAGSGTTGHAVLKQNAQDSGNRRFILVEIDPKIAENVTAERIKRVASGYTNAKGNAVEGLGGGFQFCRLSAEPLFTADGQIRPDVTFAQLAEFVWFAETGTGYASKADSPLLGVHDGRSIYLLYNGILKDQSAVGGNVLTGAVFDRLPKFAGPKVIYAAANRMGTRAGREGVTFKQTPYALEL